MVRPSTFIRIASVVLSITVVLVTDDAARAATRPGRPATTGTPNLTYTPTGEPVIECGTYKGNEAEHIQKQALHLHNQKLLQRGLKSQKATFLDYIYNNVWVVEDDGSLTLSGTNAFDMGASTFQYTNDGGGVYTVSQVAFSYDATLGTLIGPGDDGAVLVSLPFSFPYAGGSYTQMYVSGNGAVSFGDVLNPNGFYDSADFFSATPKIAAYYLDLNEVAGGDVRVRSEASKYTVTYISVREYATTITNTLQLVLYPSGNFTITYNGIGSNVANNTEPIITGFHPGGSPPLEDISFTSDLPHVSAAGAAVYEQYYSYPNPRVDEIALFNRFYQQFSDDYFQLIFFTNFTQTMAGFANELNIKNDVTGIGLGIFDGSSQYGSNGVLESRCNMNSLNAWTSSDPAARVYGKGNNFLTIMGQEAGHRWGAFAYFDNGGGPSNLMLGRSDAHWSYYADVDHSSLEGGNWVNTGGSNYMCPTTIDYFSEMDEYLFGLRTPNEVKDMFYISSASNNTTSARSVGTPLMGATATGTFVEVTVEDFIAAEGARTPVEEDEEHDLRQAFIFLIGQGTTPSQAQLDKIAGFRAAWEEYFEKSCDGRLTCNTVLTGPYAVGVICGEVRDRYSQFPVPDFTAVSVERAFTQHVPDDGRFVFRYDDGPTRGTNEDVTIIFSAPGYEPDTLETNITYGETNKRLGLNDGIWLTPIASAAGEGPVLTALRANHPNPFNPSTVIEYTLGAAGRVRVDVFDATGRRVRSLVDRTEAKGDHEVTFDGRDDRGQPLASGVYLYRLTADDFVQTRKMVLLK
jgi:hypothetical protein